MAGLNRRESVQLSLTGMPKTDRILKRIAEKDAKKITRNSMRAGLRVAAKAQKAAVPVGKTKELKKSIGSSFKKSRKTGVTQAKSGVGVGKKKPKGWYGHLVALGTALRRRKRLKKGGKVYRGGLATGNIKPNDFIQKAWKSSESAVLATIARKAREGFARLGR